MQPQGAGDITFDFTTHRRRVRRHVRINYGIAEAFGRCARGRGRSRPAAQRGRCVDGSGSGCDLRGLAADVRDSRCGERRLRRGRRAVWERSTYWYRRGRQLPRRSNQLSAKGFQTVVDIDPFGTFHVLRQGFAHLHGCVGDQHQRPAGSVPMRYQVHVGAAKAGVDQLTRILALEWPRRHPGQRDLPGPIRGHRRAGSPLPDGDPAAPRVEARPLAGGTRTTSPSWRCFLASSARATSRGRSSLVTAAAPSKRQPAIEEAGRG